MIDNIINFWQKKILPSNLLRLGLTAFTLVILLIFTAYQPLLGSSPPQVSEGVSVVNQPILQVTRLNLEVVKQLLAELGYQVEIVQSLENKDLHLVPIITSKNSNVRLSSEKLMATNLVTQKLLELVTIPPQDIDEYLTLTKSEEAPSFQGGVSLTSENKPKNITLNQNYPRQWIDRNRERVNHWLAIAKKQTVETKEQPVATLVNNSTSKEATATTNKTFKVVTKRFEPLVNYEEDRYQGFSIDFWDEIAERLGINYELSGVETIDRLLNQVKNNTADIAIAGISITAEREQEMDFSHSYYESGLQILVPQRATTISQSIWNRILAIVTRPQLYFGIGVFILILLVAAHIIWLTERNHNPEFPSGYSQGIWESFWWAAVTVTTVGYGDKTPRKLPGRIFGLFWMCAGYFIFAYFTATVTTSLTIDGLNSSIKGIEDLRGKEVATIAGTTANQYLREQKIATIPYKNQEQAYLALQTRQIDALVYDAPALQYYVHNQGAGKVKIVGSIFKPQNYGIALPINSPYRKQINSALLQLMEDGTYQEIKTRWFGD
ncbi:Bacterial extracellular solute-binding protein, family 3 (modular protein) [Hyella patelloides LEGE 07179]|uniref:Bacterial extracellular solute-binding protein, family 3 (Modular protein) n=1 Tax=Hyella patelloides LEGE 07179 TaxID=945734 RepID=A0A563VWQ0_9CYAN|nr:transporter substrate-binding domain-containing protein [Hyella patelloides]VEP15850.1 Bacterial extracellular solute-binding protein, family 3 (modular protein) [Hyella patelloides LEGE 07179]